MVSVFYSQKTEQVIIKIELSQWSKLLLEQGNHEYQKQLNNLKVYTLGEKIST